MASRIPTRPMLDEEPAITPQLGSVLFWFRFMHLERCLTMIHFSLDNRYTHLRSLAPKQGRQRNHLQELQPQHRRPLHPALHKLQIFLRFSGDQSILDISCRNFESFHQAERKTSDIVQCPWQHSDQSEDKFREVNQKSSVIHSKD